MVQQKYNCQPINKQTVTQIRNSHKSTALLNHYGENAMYIGVQKQDLLGTSLQPLKDGPYNNFVEWTRTARSAGAEMVLFNGNHRWTYMEQLYKQKFHNYWQVKKDVKNLVPGHDQDQAIDVMNEKRDILDKHSVWLAWFFDINALEEARNSSLLLHELMMNQSLPSRDDTDMDKLKNVLWLGHGKESEMADVLIADAVEKWEESKDSTSSCTAWAVSNKQLFNFLKDIYAHLCFESSPLINISLLYSNWNPYMAAFFIAIFRPMLMLLEFLVSPVILPTMEQATTKYLSKSYIISMDSK
ncbi:hypothetical protein BDR05DRAFT_1002787 [Suillus weaverae]|nr:hypothetical protein BDR05DRAFT_1002787 [Suillus weaverae]